MNEPIAFVTGVNKFDPVSVDTVLKVGTPLYTHPVKELTDEEIDKIENKVYLKTIAKGKPMGNYAKELARAILRKAGEK